MGYNQLLQSKVLFSSCLQFGILIRRWTAQFDKPFTRQIISKADPQIQKELYFQLFIGGRVMFWFVGFFLVLFFFLTGHLSVILNWHFTEVSSRDIHLATLIIPFWLWLANSNDQSCQIYFIKIKPVLMMYPSLKPLMCSSEKQIWIFSSSKIILTI